MIVLVEKNSALFTHVCRIFFINKIFKLDNELFRPILLPACWYIYVLHGNRMVVMVIFHKVSPRKPGKFLTIMFYMFSFQEPKNGCNGQFQKVCLRNHRTVELVIFNMGSLQEPQDSCNEYFSHGFSSRTTG